MLPVPPSLPKSQHCCNSSFQLTSARMRSSPESMATLKHVWTGASVLATLVTCVLAASDEAAFVRAINGDALTANSISVLLESSVHFIPASEEETVPAVLPNTVFGQIDVYEVPVTITTDPNSLEIGRERAALFFDEPLERGGYENKATLVFNNNSGLPANSSINFAGFEPYDLPPTGYNYTVEAGTQAFACARGVATDFIFTFNDTAGTSTFHDINYIVVGCGFDESKAFYLFFGSEQP